jgi:hypothetical protein
VGAGIFSRGVGVGFVASSLGRRWIWARSAPCCGGPAAPDGPAGLGRTALALSDPLMPASVPLPVILGAVLIAAWGLSVASIAWQTAIQQYVPYAQQGRVSAYLAVAQIALAPAGDLLVAPVTGAIGVRATLLGCGSSFAACEPGPTTEPRRRRPDFPAWQGAANRVGRTTR